MLCHLDKGILWCAPKKMNNHPKNFAHRPHPGGHTILQGEPSSQKTNKNGFCLRNNVLLPYFLIICYKNLILYDILLCRYITTSSLIGLNTKCKGMHWSKFNTMIIHPTNKKEWMGAWIAEICMIGSIHVIECTDANISCAALVTFYAKLYYIYQQAPTNIMNRNDLYAHPLCCISHFLC